MSGNETKTAYDGLEAIATAETFQPDVILLDIGLPKMNGKETFSNLKTRCPEAIAKCWDTKYATSRKAISRRTLGSRRKTSAWSI